MKTKQVKPLILISCLIAITCISMASSKNISRTIIHPAQTVSNKNGIITLSANLVRDKIVSGSDGIVSLALTMRADTIDNDNALGHGRKMNNVDMVVVLDRSGSMSGKKLNDAKNAALELISRLTGADRFALVTYSDTAQCITALVNVTPSAKRRLNKLISGISAGGGTNLGQGLQTGIDILTSTIKNGNFGRLILVSDGLTNKGITNINALGNMASVSMENGFSISTAGIGTDFNEQLMTSIADHGTGNYYFLENPAAFAAVFNNEFEQTRTAAATFVKVSFDEKNGIKLVDAGGYPIEMKNNTAFFSPGNLKSGETRKLFLRLKVPTDRISTFDISGISLQYHYNDDSYRVSLSNPLKLACVEDLQAAMASIDKETWEHKVLKEDFSRLKEAVAGDIRSGRKEEAVIKIDQYYADQQEINTSVQSDIVTGNLEHDLKQLRDTVVETFTGKPSAVIEKQKRNAKVLQFEGYKERRKN